MRTLGQPLPPHVQKVVQPHADVISNSYAEVSGELQGLNGWRYARNITGGNQEWIESATFEHYLTTARLMTFEEAASEFRRLCHKAPETAEAMETEDSGRTGAEPELSVEDYVLGIYDMTGELMRFAITAMATTGELPTVSTKETEGAETQGSQRTVLTDLRTLRSGLEGLEVGYGSHFARDVDKKADVMRSSVEKVERALYGLVVRGAERPKGWMPDLESGGGRREVGVEG